MESISLSELMLFDDDALRGRVSDLSDMQLVYEHDMLRAMGMDYHRLVIYFAEMDRRFLVGDG